MERDTSKILIVEDEEDIRELVDAVLEQKEYIRDSAADGAEAIQKLEKNQYDLVITDLGMPHMDGREVAERVKQESPITPLILLTGWGTRMNAEKEIPAHVDRVLSKPPKMRELRRVMAELI